MFKKIRIILVLFSLSLTLCVMSNTFSRYVATTSGDVEAAFANWKILLNSADITNGNQNNISITPTMYENANVAAGKIAPSSRGYFDIEINPTDVDLSFNYTISLNIENEDMLDLMITEYCILPFGTTDDTLITKVPLENNMISQNMVFDNNSNSFQFDPFTVRVYFQWYEGQGELSNDSTDTEVITNATANNEKFKISANITFTQTI